MPHPNNGGNRDHPMPNPSQSANKAKSAKVNHVTNKNYYMGYARGTNRAKQAYLKRMGFYKGAIDGIVGPQTKAAIAAFKNRRNKPAGSKPPASRPPARGGGGGGGGGAGKKKSGGGVRMPSGTIVNAAKYGNAMTQMQYGGLISELQRQRNEQGLQGTQNLADIRGWFDEVGQLAAQQTQKDDTYSQGLRSQQAGDFQSVLASLGGAANQGAGSVGSFQQLMAGALASQSQAQHNYDAGQQTLVGREGANAMLMQQRMQDQQQADIAAKLQSAMRERGSASVKNRMDAEQMRLQQMAGIQNMNLAAQEFGMKQQMFGLQVKQQQLANKNAALANQALGQQLAGKLKKTPWTQTSVGDRAKMVTGVNRVMYALDGTTKLPPSQAWNKASNMLRSLGYDVKKNPKVRKWLSQSWLNYVTDYNDGRDKKYEPRKNGTPYLSW